MTQAPAVDKPTRRQSAPQQTPPDSAKKSGKRVKAEKPAPIPQPNLGRGPRVDLLPPIVEVRRRQNKTIRLLMLSLVGIAAIVVVASLAVALTAGVAEAMLAKERQRGTDLLNQQGQYAEVIQVRAQLADAQTAQLAALYPDADWARIMRELDAALPAGMSITSESIAVNGLSGVVDTPLAGSVAIDAPGVVEISFSAAAPSFDSPSPLLAALQNMTGYVSANVSAVANTSEKGYDITGAVRLDGRALGGLARQSTLNADALKQLQDALVLAAITPPAAPAPATDDTATGTGE